MQQNFTTDQFSLYLPYYFKVEYVIDNIIEVSDDKIVVSGKI